ncbi:MAG: GntR family transcriptional regulator [Acidobacteria bacterium]|nr:GntR family transcriptional regulator [Acidobacteriota bacterium]MBU4253718.1 GntR family transcriptional regulator [Acidobacteriota bacterium]MBU4495141.1 GntR family transcriptional regulator [Acidobacteriota bacterium]
MEIGRMNRMRVVKALDFGVYLDGGELGEILLPKKYLNEDCKVGGEVDVFLYLDSEDRLIATTLPPLAMVGEFAFLKCVEVSPVGAFLDWGLLKDLLVPFREQRQKMEKGRHYIVRIYLDEKTTRIAASSRHGKFLSDTPPDYREGEEVDLLIAGEIAVGYKAIVNERHWGLLYRNEVFQPLKIGQRIKGYVTKIRDGKKVDLTLQKQGGEHIRDAAAIILDVLRAKGGFIPVTDSSSPEKIAAVFNLSKKAYKKAVGGLYKRHLITIEKHGIQLVE